MAPPVKPLFQKGCREFQWEPNEPSPRREWARRQLAGTASPCGLSAVRSPVAELRSPSAGRRAPNIAACRRSSTATYYQHYSLQIYADIKFKSLSLISHLMR
ncbi:unnamed protein product [Chrysodeixis includens]|uniref:Uncharacterized protein n=1 Tax=Chrysodeixis includens TaxID=689277 RepID=A0A9N8L0J7_CHRIL|nr:unnamed protein product [Chrysodeixis includens]